jgi:hypothetical protein
VTAGITNNAIYGLTSGQIVSGLATVSGTTTLSSEPALDTSHPFLSATGPANLAITATSAVKAEGQAGTTPFTFTVTRSGNLGIAAIAKWAVSGTATATDFTGSVLPSGTVSFAAGETSKVITANVAGDTTVEANEDFTVSLSGPSTGTTITTANATGTIINDDSATPPSTSRTLTLRLSEDAYRGDATFIVAVDGRQLGVAQAVTASHAMGNAQAFNFSVDLAAGKHDIAVSFLNDLFAGTASTDRNLYINAITYGGAVIPGAPVAMYSAGTHHFTATINT